MLKKVLLGLFLIASIAGNLLDEDDFFTELDDLETASPKAALASSPGLSREADALIKLSFQGVDSARFHQEARWDDAAHLNHLSRLTSAGAVLSKDRQSDSAQERILRKKAAKKAKIVAKTLKSRDQWRSRYVKDKENFLKVKRQIKDDEERLLRTERQVSQVKRNIRIRQSRVQKVKKIKAKFAKDKVRTPGYVKDMSKNYKGDLNGDQKYYRQLVSQGEKLNAIVKNGPKKLKTALKRMKKSERNLAKQERLLKSRQAATRKYARKMLKDANKVRKQILPSLKSVNEMGLPALRHRIASLILAAEKQQGEAAVNLRTRARHLAELGRIVFGNIGAVVAETSQNKKVSELLTRNVAVSPTTETAAPALNAAFPAAERAPASNISPSTNTTTTAATTNSPARGKIASRRSVRAFFRRRGLGYARKRIAKILRQLKGKPVFARLNLETTAFEIIKIAKSLWSDKFGGLRKFTRSIIAGKNPRRLRAKVLGIVRSRGEDWVVRSASIPSSNVGGFVRNLVATRRREILLDAASKVFPSSTSIAALSSNGTASASNTTTSVKKVALAVLRENTIDQIRQAKVSLAEARIVAVKTKLAKAGPISKFFLESEIHELLDVSRIAFGPALDVNEDDLKEQKSAVEKVRYDAIGELTKKGKEFTLRILNSLMSKGKKASFIRKYFLAKKAEWLLDLYRDIWQHEPTLLNFIDVSMVGPSASTTKSSDATNDLLEHRALLHMRDMGLSALEKEVLDIKKRISSQNSGPLSKYFLEGELHEVLDLGQVAFGNKFDVSKEDVESQKNVVAALETPAIQFFESKGQQFALDLLRNLVLKAKSASTLKRYILSQKSKWLLTIFNQVWKKDPSVHRFVINTIAGRYVINLTQSKIASVKQLPKQESTQAFLKRVGPVAARRIIVKLLARSRRVSAVSRAAIASATATIITDSSKIYGRRFEESVANLVKVVARGKGSKKLESRVRQSIKNRGRRWFKRFVERLDTKSKRASKIVGYFLHKQVLRLVKIGGKYLPEKIVQDGAVSEAQIPSPTASGEPTERDHVPFMTCEEELQRMTANFELAEEERRDQFSAIKFSLRRLRKMRVILDVDMGDEANDENLVAALESLGINESHPGAATPKGIIRLLRRWSRKLRLKARAQRRALERKRAQCSAWCERTLDFHTNRLTEVVSSRKLAKEKARALLALALKAKQSLGDAQNIFAAGQTDAEEREAKIRNDVKLLSELEEHVNTVALTGHQTDEDSTLLSSVGELVSRRPEMEDLAVEMTSDSADVPTVIAIIHQHINNLAKEHGFVQSGLAARKSAVDTAMKNFSETRANFDAAVKEAEDSNNTFKNLRDAARFTSNRCQDLSA